MDVLDWDIDVVQKVTIKLDCVTARHENHNLLLHVLFQEGEEKLELL